VRAHIAKKHTRRASVLIQSLGLVIGVYGGGLLSERAYRTTPDSVFVGSVVTIDPAVHMNSTLDAWWNLCEGLLHDLCQTVIGCEPPAPANDLNTCMMRIIANYHQNGFDPGMTPQGRSERIDIILTLQDMALSNPYALLDPDVVVDFVVTADEMLIGLQEPQVD
jgi:hypothetical protein